MKALRNHVDDKFAKADAALDQVEAEIEQLQTLKSYLQGTGDMDPALPSDIQMAALSVRSAKSAGVATSPALIRRIDETIDAASTTLARMKSVVDRRRHASTIGLSKGLQAKALSVAAHPHSTKSETAIFKRAAHRYSVAEKRAMAKSKAAQAQFNKAKAMGA